MQVIGYAVVDQSGVLFHASGVLQVDHIGEGTYHVTFDTAVADACQVASIAHSGVGGWISAYGGVAAGPNVIEVLTGIWEGLPGGVVVNTRKNRTFQLLLVR
jgi:hypothetical protein